MRIAGAAAAGFAIGFIFGAAESSLRKLTPLFAKGVSPLLHACGVPKGTAIDIAENVWKIGLSVALGIAAAALGFLVGVRIAGPIGGLVGAGAGLVGYLFGRELFKK